MCNPKGYTKYTFVKKDFQPKTLQTFSLNGEVNFTLNDSHWINLISLKRPFRKNNMIGNLQNLSGEDLLVLTIYGTKCPQFQWKILNKCTTELFTLENVQHIFVLQSMHNTREFLAELEAIVGQSFASLIKNSSEFISLSRLDAITTNTNSQNNVISGKFVFNLHYDYMMNCLY